MKTQLRQSPRPFIFLLFFLSTLAVPAQIFTNLHTFGSIPNDGRTPGGIIISDGVIYGTTLNGGINGNGSIFRMNVDGSGYSNIYSFSAATGGGRTNTDGARPGGAFSGGNQLTLSGATLFDTTFLGGTNGKGTIFRVNTDGTEFTNLHNFTGADGFNPNAGLLLSNATLYGTTMGGPDGSYSGTLFRLEVNGSNFVSLHVFSQLTGGVFTNGEGVSPIGGLSFSGDALIGSTTLGGPGGYGTAFRVGLNGEDFTNLHEFSAPVGNVLMNLDGAEPEADLVTSQGFVFGTAALGGTNLQSAVLVGCGVIFRLTTNGSDYTVLHYFSTATNRVNGFYPNSDGTSPVSKLVLSGHTLYGTATQGGTAGTGTIYGLNTNGQDFVVYHSFEPVHTNNVNGNTNTDGSYPTPCLVLYGGKLFGTAANGGLTYGTLFSLTLPQPMLSIVTSETNAVLSWPTNYIGFSLQSVDDLSSNSPWTDITEDVFSTNGQNVVTTPLKSSKQFYRLLLRN